LGGRYDTVPWSLFLKKGEKLYNEIKIVVGQKAKKAKRKPW